MRAISAVLALAALLAAGTPPLAAGQPLRAAAESRDKAEVQVALIYLLLAHTRGPANAPERAGQPFQFGLLGDDPFGEKLQALLERQLYGRSIRVVHALAPEELDDCDLVFVCSSEERALGKILDHFATRPQILISDIDGFARMGGMVELVLVDGHVNYDLNLRSASRANVEFELRVIDLAHEVHR